MIDALAFLPPDDVPAAMTFLKSAVPTGEHADALMDLLTYFDRTYVSGGVRTVRRPATANSAVIRLRRTAPLFAVPTWNVFQSTLAGNQRTNNICESWNSGFQQLVGHHHPSIWTAIEAIQQDQAFVSTTLIQSARGQPPKKRVRRATQQMQDRLQNLCVARRDGKKSIEETLRGVGHV